MQESDNNIKDLEKEAHERALDGLLRETARGGTERDLDFVAQIMNSVKETETVETVETVTTITTINFPQILKTVGAVAASVVFIACLSYYFINSTKMPSIKKGFSTPRILASSPGGILNRRGIEKAIDNGMELEQKDLVRVFPSSNAYVQFPDMSRLELGPGSVMKFEKLNKRKKFRNTVSLNNKIIFKKGVIDADIIKSSSPQSFAISTPNGEFMTRGAKFVLVNSPELSCVEVKEGSVRFKKDNNSSPVTVKAGQYCVIVPGLGSKVYANRNAMDYHLAMEIERHKERLASKHKGLEELLLQLYKKKKADVCLKKNNKKKKRFF